MRAKSNSIRIIAGQWRGRRLPVLDHQGLRPTTDRVRETVFNWLMYDVNGTNCLDLFAGSGALGVECLSRGAKSVQFVENNAAVANSLSENLQSLSSDQQTLEYKVHQGNAIDFLAKQALVKYDLVFLDPPFNADLLTKVITLLVDNDCLNDDALIYLEQDSAQDAVIVPDNWRIHRQGKAGQSAYFLYTT